MWHVFDWDIFQIISVILIHIIYWYVVLLMYLLQQSFYKHWTWLRRISLTKYYYHATAECQNEPTLYSCLNVKELLARNRPHIWSLSDSNGIRTDNQLVRKRTLNRLGRLTSVHLRTKWLWVRIPLLSLQLVYISISNSKTWLDVYTDSNIKQ